MKLIIVISAAAIILLSGFVINGNNTGTQSLYDTKWSLKNIHTKTGIEEVNTKAFLKFDEKKKTAGGNGSCNSFGSDFTISGNEIIFKNIFSTKMYCEGVQQTEDAFFGALEKVNSFEIKNRELILYNGRDILLEFISE